MGVVAVKGRRSDAEIVEGSARVEIEEGVGEAVDEVGADLRSLVLVLGAGRDPDGEAVGRR